VKKPAPEDRPKNHVWALPERAHLALRFPVVEGYAFALRKNLIRCDVDGTESLRLESSHEPTATFLQATAGYHEGSAAPLRFGYEPQDRTAYYESNHVQTIKFQIAREVVEQLVNPPADVL